MHPGERHPDHNDLPTHAPTSSRPPDACTQMLGERHPDTRASEDNLATLLRAATLFKGAQGAAADEKARPATEADANDENAVANAPTA